MLPLHCCKKRAPPLFMVPLLEILALIFMYFNATLKLEDWYIICIYILSGSDFADFFF